MNPALASVRMQVEKRGQKQMLHVTTTRAVEAEYVHLYVELGVPGKRMCGWPRCGCSRIRIRHRPAPVAAVARPRRRRRPPAR
jgi:hypothetical protein